ncbi:MAG: HAD family hydrolase [Deltaproteobacteria bacterium]|nr:HAD family hydrolase [Deltaproteobacteria bacterium]
MSDVRAVLFDFGGTLFDYETVAPGERESIVALARWAGSSEDPKAIIRAYRASLKSVFYEYLPQPYYLHRDMFRDALFGMVNSLGISLTEEQFARYRALQWERRARDFLLREGVHETLAEIRDRGLHVGMVSNIDDDQLGHMLELARVRPHFDSILSSEAAQSCKPDASIFQEALRRAGCAPHEALFVGDSLQQDIAGANRVGLQSVLIWSDPEREPTIGEHRPRHVIRRIPELLDLLT